MFVRALFPDDASAEEDTEPAAPLQLVSRPAGGTSAVSPATARSAGQRQTRMDAAGRLLQQTAPSAGKAPAEDEAFAPTRTPAARQYSAATAPGQGSAVTSAPGDDEARAFAARLGAGRRRLTLVALGLAVLLGVGAVAFVAGQRDPRSEPAGPPPHPQAAVPAPPPPPEVRPPAPPAPPAAAEPPAARAAPGFLQLTAQPWGKLYVDGTFVADVEG